MNEEQVRQLNYLQDVDTRLEQEVPDVPTADEVYQVTDPVTGMSFTVRRYGTRDRYIKKRTEIHEP